MEENHPQDDGRRWGYMTPEVSSGARRWPSVWVELPKLPLLRAGLGPPPFTVTLPSGSQREIVHDPAEPR
jgi:hypothetical protein